MSGPRRLSKRKCLYYKNNNNNSWQKVTSNSIDGDICKLGAI